MDEPISFLVFVESTYTVAFFLFAMPVESSFMLNTGGGEGWNKKKIPVRERERGGGARSSRKS